MIYHSVETLLKSWWLLRVPPGLALDTLSAWCSYVSRGSWNKQHFFA